MRLHTLRKVLPRSALFQSVDTRELLLRHLSLQFLQAQFLHRVDEVVVVAPVRVVVRQVGHRHALPEPQLLPHSLHVDAPLPARLVLVVPRAELSQGFVRLARVGLHLPDLFAQPRVLGPLLCQLRTVAPVPGGHIGHVLLLVVVELLQHCGEHGGILCREVAVLVAADLGALEELGQEGDGGVDVCFLSCR